MSMWFTPSSTALRSTAIACSRLPGIAPGANAGPRCGRRIAPNPIRLTLRSPSVQVPAAAAPPVSPVTAGVCHTQVAALSALRPSATCNAAAPVSPVQDLRAPTGRDPAASQTGCPHAGPGPARAGLCRDDRPGRQSRPGLMPVSKAVCALLRTHVNGTALHQASHIPGSGGFLPIFLPEEATQRSRGALSPGHSSKMGR